MKLYLARFFDVFWRDVWKFNLCSINAAKWSVHIYDKWLTAKSFPFAMAWELAEEEKLQSKLRRKNIYNGPMISNNDIFIAIALLMVKFQLSSICFVLWLCSHQVCVLSCDFAVIKCVFCLVTLQSSSVCFVLWLCSHQVFVFHLALQSPVSKLPVCKHNFLYHFVLPLISKFQSLLLNYCASSDQKIPKLYSLLFGRWHFLEDLLDNFMMLKALALAASYPQRPLLLPFFLEQNVALMWCQSHLEALFPHSFEVSFLTSFFGFHLGAFTVALLETLEAAGFFMMLHFFLILSLLVGTNGTSAAESPESEGGLYFVGPEERQLSVWPSWSGSSGSSWPSTSSPGRTLGFFWGSENHLQGTWLPFLVTSWSQDPPCFECFESI